MKNILKKRVIAAMCKRQVKSSKFWHFISSTFWQSNSSTLYLPYITLGASSEGLFKLKWQLCIRVINIFSGFYE